MPINSGMPWASKYFLLISIFPLAKRYLPPVVRSLGLNVARWRKGREKNLREISSVSRCSRSSSIGAETFSSMKHSNSLSCLSIPIKPLERFCLSFLSPCFSLPIRPEAARPLGPSLFNRKGKLAQDEEGVGQRPNQKKRSMFVFAKGNRDPPVKEPSVPFDSKGRKNPPSGAGEIPGPDAWRLLLTAYFGIIVKEIRPFCTSTCSTQTVTMSPTDTASRGCLM